MYKKILTSKKTILSFSYFSGVQIINVAASNLIEYLFPNRPIIPDLFFYITPYVQWTEYFTDFILILATLLFLAHIIPKHMNKIPYYFTILGTGNLIRAPLILLTPMGRPTGNDYSYGIVSGYLQHGMFPSGHTIGITLLYLLVENTSHKLKVFMGFLVVLEVITLILSRGHYSIDIVGGLIIAYLINDISKRHEKKLLLNNTIYKIKSTLNGLKSVTSKIKL